MLCSLVCHVMSCDLITGAAESRGQLRGRDGAGVQERLPQVRTSNGACSQTNAQTHALI